MDVESLNRKYAISGLIRFVLGKGALPLAIIDNHFAKAEVSLYGAQVLSFRPKGKEEVLWLSEKSVYEPGKAIRGGIPVCFPWFGPHKNDTTKPAHGFARLSLWDVTGTRALENGAVELRLNLVDSALTNTFWPYSFQAELIVVVGPSMEVTLRYTNTGDESFICSDALHSYINVSNISNIKINRLEGINYYDGMETDKIFKQSDPYLTIQQEENRRYIDHISDCIIEDEGFDRKIRIAKKGSKVTVVWNPWEGARNFPDMNEDGYKTMICVEAANAYGDMVNLAPGKSFNISTVISVE